MSREHWWNLILMGKMKHSEKNVSECVLCLTQIPCEEALLFPHESKVGYAIKRTTLNECVIYHVLDKQQY